MILEQSPEKRFARIFCYIVFQTSPDIGTIYDIDIKGPDNGSVILVEKTSSSFTFQTITTPFSQTGSHPEAGVRQFGFERNSDGSITFYTKGVSQAAIGITDPIGQYYQGVGWNALMKGISDEMNRRGGISDPSTISIKRCDQDEKT